MGKNYKYTHKELRQIFINKMMTFKQEENKKRCENCMAYSKGFFRMGNSCDKLILCRRCLDKYVK